MTGVQTCALPIFDRKHSAPDLVLDRLNTLTMSIMQLNMAVGQIMDKLNGMDGDE